MTFVMLT